MSITVNQEISSVGSSSASSSEVHAKCITDALKKAEKEHEEGKCLRFSSAKDAQKWMDEL